MTTVFLQIGLLLLAGIIYRRVPDMIPPADVRRVIASVVLNIFIPMLTFGVMCRAKINTDLLTVPLISALSVLAGLAAGWIVYARILHKQLDPPAIGSLLLATTWCNAMYMGLPITTAIVGEHMSHIPIMFDYLGMTPLLFTAGTLISSRFGAAAQQVSVGRGIVRALTMPPTLAIAAGLIANLTGVEVPDWAVLACGAAGKVVAPLMLFSIGLTLTIPSWRSIPLLLPSALIRTIAVPTIMLPIARYVIVDPDVFRSVLLECAMPSMMLTMVFAERFGLDESVLAQAILLSTLLSIATLPQISLLLP